MSERMLSSGVRVRVKKVSPLLLDEVRRQSPPPIPPMVEVDYGEGMVQEANPADPAYMAVLDAHNIDLSTRFISVLLARGVDPVDSDDEVRRQVEQLRRDMQDAGMDLPDWSDKMIFLKFIAFLDKNDIQVLLQEIQGMSQPTEEAVQATMESFRS